MQLSFRLRRWCSTSTSSYSSSFYGVSFPGSVLNSTTFFSLSPSYADCPHMLHRMQRSIVLLIVLVPRSLAGLTNTNRQVSTTQTCDVNAQCVGGTCVCNPGYVGSGLSCTRTHLLCRSALERGD